MAWFRPKGAAADILVAARTPGGLDVAFDVETTVEYYAAERYLPFIRPWHTRLPFHHHIVPGFARHLAGILFSAIDVRRRPPSQPFYPAWPIEPVGAALDYLSGASAAQAERDGRLSGRLLYVLSHDVDTAAGQARVGLLAEEEAKRGLVSTWFIVPRHFRLDEGLLDELGRAGHEIGCHGYDHSGRLPFLTTSEIRARFEEVRPFLEAHRVCGFRSPGLLRTRNLLEALGAYFRYDSSVPDTEAYTGAGYRNGACQVRPFMRDGVLEMPITVPLDAALLHYGYRPDAILELWRRKLTWLRQVGGLAVVDTHPEPQYSGNPAMKAVYGRLLDTLAEIGRPAGTLAEAAGRLRMEVSTS